MDAAVEDSLIVHQSTTTTQAGRWSDPEHGRPQAESVAVQVGHRSGGNESPTTPSCFYTTDYHADSEDPPLKIQLASDLHIETWNRHKFYPKQYLMETVIEPRAKVLALLGDIGVVGTDAGFDDYCTFLEHQATQFELVLVLTGNHEFYSACGGQENSQKPLSVEAIRRRIKGFSKNKRNIIFMDRNTIFINGVRVVGVTLWTDIPERMQTMAESMVNDYSFIHVKEGKSTRLVKAKDVQGWFKEEVQFIKDNALEAKRKKQQMVVLTHHAPTLVNSSDPKFAESPISIAFSSNLDHLMGRGLANPYSAIHTWAFGHTHWCCDQHINGVHVVSNQYGYAGAVEEPDYEAWFTFEV